MYWNSAKKTLSLKLMTRGPSDGSQTAGSVNEIVVTHVQKALNFSI